MLCIFALLLLLLSCNSCFFFSPRFWATSSLLFLFSISLPHPCFGFSFILFTFFIFFQWIKYWTSESLLFFPSHSFCVSLQLTGMTTMVKIQSKNHNNKSRHKEIHNNHNNVFLKRKRKIYVNKVKAKYQPQNNRYNKKTPCRLFHLNTKLCLASAV